MSKFYHIERDDVPTLIVETYQGYPYQTPTEVPSELVERYRGLKYDFEAVQDEIEAYRSRKIFTVMLLRPGYKTDNYGQDTFTESTEADTWQEAVEHVKKACLDADALTPGSRKEYEQYLDDLQVLAVMKGKVEFVV